MNDDTISDLKQFISATVSQEVAGLRSDIGSDIKNLDDKISTKIDDLSLSVSDAIDVSNETTDTQLKDHEKRITRLEHKAV